MALQNPVEDGEHVLGHEDIWIDRFGDLGARLYNLRMWDTWHVRMVFPLSCVEDVAEDSARVF